MRTYDEYHRILTLWEKYGNKKLIARETGIPRGTVCDCIRKFKNVEGLENSELHRTTIDGEPLVLRQLKKIDSSTALLHENYSYLLGLYLGDGTISKSSGHRVYRLRIALDKKYPGIIQSAVDVLEVLFPDNQIGIVSCVGCVNVSLYHKHLPQVFPQDGDGKKHERDIILDHWQEEIVDQFPLEFFRGLYHSDGSRSQNIVKGKNYPRYMFSNYSDDIRWLFTETAEKLGLSWTTANARNVAISKREDVAWLDEHVGTKS